VNNHASTCRLYIKHEQDDFSLFLTMTNYFTVKSIVSAHTIDLWIEHLKQSLNDK